MTPSRTFLRIAGACGLVAGLATFLLWLLPWFYGDPATLEARLALHDNSLYQLRLWVSFLNVFFVVLASWGLTHYKWSSAPARASTGMLFLFFYAVAELLGRSIMIFVREQLWTAQLEGAPTPETSAGLLQAITRFDEIFGGLYVLLLICFFVSSLCFASATSGGAGSRALGEQAPLPRFGIGLSDAGCVVHPLARDPGHSRVGLPGRSAPEPIHGWALAVESRRLSHATPRLTPRCTSLPTRSTPPASPRFTSLPIRSTPPRGQSSQVTAPEARL